MTDRPIGSAASWMHEERLWHYACQRCGYIAVTEARMLNRNCPSCTSHGKSYTWRKTMTDRPRWARGLQRLITDEILDDKYGWPADDSADPILDEIEAAVLPILCRHFGHEIIDDQCGIPEHRYCAWCRRPAAHLEADDDQ